MAKKIDIAELRRLTAAITQLHAWQGDLLARAASLVEQGGVRPKTLAAIAPGPEELIWPGWRRTRRSPAKRRE